MAAERAERLKLLSLLLQYPTDDLLAARAELAAAGAGEGRAVERFLDWWVREPARGLQRAYVETFDFTRRNSLYLSYHVHGDRRQRGVALLRLKQRYAAAGLELLDGELPDYLPVMLEFAALAPPDVGLAALAESRDAVELVRASLHEAGSRYALLLDAIAELLPGLTGAQAARVRRLAAEGPPSEEVGLEPFAPPEVMPMGTGR
jgi:nitrate reductase molybdenum cofactor assembly chaperone NarJ/NarW